MPVAIPVGAELDERSAAAAANRAQKYFADAGRDAGRQFSAGLDQTEQSLRRFEARAKDTYDKVADASGKLRAEEAKLQDLRDRGARDAQIVSQAERLEAARRAEARAIRVATTALREYDQARHEAESGGAGAGGSFLSGLQGAITGAGASGQDAANEFVDGFAGASALTRVGAAGGPIGLALAGVATLGVGAGKLLAGGIADGLASLQVQDVFRARLGVDDATMARYGDAAAAAFINGYGTSVEDNLRAIQFGGQGGLFDMGSASQAEVQQFAEQVSTVSTVMEEDSQAIARGVRNFIKTGMVDGYQEAFDLLTAATQQGLNISSDLLDSFEEYGTKFRDIGLSGAEALGLINQMWEGGARNVDVAADALKEIAISVVDGTDLTKNAFAALGFNADEMSRRFVEGGESAKVAFGAILTAISQIEDPLEQERVGLALFKTKWEDVGDAIKNADLSTAATELGNIEGASKRASDTIGQHANQWDLLGRNIDQAFVKFKEWLADSSIGKFFNQAIPYTLNTLFQDTNGYGSVPDTNVAPPQSPGSLLLPPAAPPPAQPPGNGLPGPLGQLPLDGAPLPGATPPALPRQPAVPMPTGSGGSGGDEAKFSAPPSEWSLESIPLGAFPGEEGVLSGVPHGVTGLPGVGPGAPTGPGYYEVDPQRVFDAESSLINAQTAVQNARFDYLETMADADATEQEKYNAKAKLIQTGRALQSAESKLAEAQQGTWKKMEAAAKSFSTGMDQIGAALDNDFGISEGLPGLAENLTKFLANLAFAPMMGALSAISAANPSQGGHGIIGILGAQGAFGPRFTGIDYSKYGYGASSAMGPAAFGGGLASGAPSEAQVKAIAAQFGLQVTSEDRPGDPGYHGQGMALDVSNGSGNTPEMRAFADYMSATFGPYLKELIYSDGSFTGQIGDGENVSGTGYYDADTLADHQNHVHIAAQWGQSAAAATTAMDGFTAAATNASSAIGSGFPWDAVAKHESGGDWDNNNTGGHMTSSGAPRGGLQITDGTWRSFGGTEFAPTANLASKAQQMAVADRIAFTGYNGTPPQGLEAWEAITNGSTAADGITVDSRPPVGGVGVSPTGFLPGATGPLPGPLPLGGGGGGGLPGMGIGAPQAAPFALTPGMGGTAFPAQGGGGFSGLGGLPMAGISTALSAVDLLAPGAGQAAQIGMQLANRAIGYAGQVAGIGVSGLMETFLPSGSPLGNLGNSWFGKLAAGFAGARPALPNVAGQQAPSNPNPQGQQGGQPGQQIGTNIEKLEYNNHQATEDRAAVDLTRNLEAQAAPTGKR